MVITTARSAHAQPPASTSRTPEQQALAFLAREVPAWNKEHKCFSCHNNGDAARALYLADRLGYDVSEQALADTTNWLSRPGQWKNNRGDPRFSDKTLADIQFGAALVAARSSGKVEDQSPIRAAAELAAARQQDDGSWKIGAEGALGSPVTYGPALATVTAMRTLQAAGDERFAKNIQLARQWIQRQRPSAVLDASAVLIGISDRDDKAAQAAWRHCLEVLRDSQASSGGWGPYRGSPTEVFDTAIAVVALLMHRDAPGAAVMIARGRQFLIAQQLPEGDWLETTRPTGFDSYAQRLSTTGWATQALLLSKPDGK